MVFHHFALTFLEDTMKKTTNTRQILSTSTKIAIAATMLSVPMMTSPVTGLAQKVMNPGTVSIESSAPSASEKQHYTIKLTNATVCKIIGVDNGRTIYQNDKNEYFYLDTKTGDMKFLTSDFYMKHKGDKAASQSARNTFMKIKMDNDRVTLLGIDTNGNVVQQNSRGEKFYLDSKGDMVFVK